MSPPRVPGRLLALCAKVPNDADAALIGKQVQALVLQYGFLDIVRLSALVVL
jgi:hypothetical protein